MCILKDQWCKGSDIKFTTVIACSHFSYIILLATLWPHNYTILSVLLPCIKKMILKKAIIFIMTKQPLENPLEGMEKALAR